ncbi:MAG TPA: ATP-dependent helicase HrpB, partial [Marinobacter sp.]|nr:ATP-dependent helicase HrpB [Marinobacter sp.]
WLVAADLDGRAREATIYRATAVDLADLERDLAPHIQEGEEAFWDDRRGTIVARHVRQLGALVLAEKPLQQIAPELIRQGLLDAVRRKGLESLPWTDAARQWRARVQLLGT